MTILPANKSDLPTVQSIYARARAFMKEVGNPLQWRDDYPTDAIILSDIENGHLYLVMDDAEVVGVFALVFGDDPTYARIDGGDWLNDEPYVTVHRIASSGKRRGVLAACLEYAATRCGNIRIDTHEDNRVMRHLLEKQGFSVCGTIYVANGDPRIAYQKTLM